MTAIVESESPIPAVIPTIKAEPMDSPIEWFNHIIRESSTLNREAEINILKTESIPQIESQNILEITVQSETIEEIQNFQNDQTQNFEKVEFIQNFQKMEETQEYSKIENVHEIANCQAIALSEKIQKGYMKKLRTCKLCQKQFSSSGFYDHVNSVHRKIRFACQECPLVFTVRNGIGTFFEFRFNIFGVVSLYMT